MKSFAMNESPAFLTVPCRLRIDGLTDRELYALASPRRKQKAKTRRALHAEMGRRYLGLSAAPEMAAVPVNIAAAPTEGA